MPYFVVQTNAVAGREKEFHEWYDSTHIPEILALDGFVSAQRFEKSATQRTDAARNHEYRFLALYEIEGDPAIALGALGDAMSNGMEMSSAMEEQRLSIVYEELTDKVHA